MHIPRLNIPRSSGSVSTAFATASAAATVARIPSPYGRQPHMWSRPSTKMWSIRSARSSPPSRSRVKPSVSASAAPYRRFAPSMSPATVSATQRTSARRGYADSTSAVSRPSTVRSTSRPCSSHSLTPPVRSAIRPSSGVSPASAAWRSASTTRPRRASAWAMPRWRVRNRSGASSNRRFSQ